MRTKRDINKGFSLIELLLYIAIVSIMMVVITSFFGTIVESSLRSQTINEVQQNSTQILNFITQNIRNASNINSPSTGNNATSMIITVSGSPIGFDLNSGNIRYTANPLDSLPTYVNLNSNRVTVTSLTFTNMTGGNSEGNIRIQMTLSRVNPDSRTVLNYTETFYADAALRY